MVVYLRVLNISEQFTFYNGGLVLPQVLPDSGIHPVNLLYRCLALLVLQTGSCHLSEEEKPPGNFKLVLIFPKPAKAAIIGYIRRFGAVYAANVDLVLERSWKLSVASQIGSIWMWANKLYKPYVVPEARFCGCVKTGNWQMWQARESDANTGLSILSIRFCVYV